MKRKIRIQRLNIWNIGITVALACLFIVICIQSTEEFRILQDTTEKYIACEKDAKQLQDGSDYLTEQVRLYVFTGQTKYRTLYLKEAKNTRRREKALDNLQLYFDGTDSFEALQDALQGSYDLMNTDYYSMRLVSEAIGETESDWSEEICNVILSEEDMQLSNEEKMEKAQQMICDDQYQNARTKITEDVTKCINSLIAQTRNKQGRVTTVFSDMYFKLKVGIAILVVWMFVICMVTRKLLVKPLLLYNKNIAKEQMLPPIGAEELQQLGETYNMMYRKHRETQKLIRHQAEHDVQTDLLNRRSFEKILRIYEEGEEPFALILVDVDKFKSINDTYGHAMGDIIIKKVAHILKAEFRSVDYVCRIGGDEFAIIMREMTSNLNDMIEDKIKHINKAVNQSKDDIPGVTLSVGVACSDRENPGENIFKDADEMLYRVKKNGRNGCDFY